MNRAERIKRDAQILQLFVAGATYTNIATAVGLKSAGTVHDIVQRELANAAQRRGLLADEAYAVYQERTERLFRAHWMKALDGDHKSAEICRKLLAQQARFYGIDNVPILPNPMGVVDNDDETDPLKGEDPLDELARLRAARAGA